MQIFTYPDLLSATLPVLSKPLCRREARPLQRSHHRAEHFPHQQSHFGPTVWVWHLDPGHLTNLSPCPCTAYFPSTEEEKNLSRGMSHISDLKTRAEISVINWLFSVLSNTGAEDMLIAKVFSTPICPVPVVQKDPWSQRLFFLIVITVISVQMLPPESV